MDVLDHPSSIVPGARKIPMLLRQGSVSAMTTMEVRIARSGFRVVTIYVAISVEDRQRLTALNVLEMLIL